MVVQRAVGKCSPSGIFKIYQEASPERKLLLENSVFGGIFRMPMGVGFVGDVIDGMLSFWVERNQFRIGKRDVYLRKMDIALILELSVVEPTKYTPTKEILEKETIRYKYFGGVNFEKIKRSNIETVLRIVKSDDDFLKLALLFVLCTFLFPGSHQQVSDEHLQLVDAIENFNETPWGLLVYSDLMEYIEKGAANRKIAEKDKDYKPYNVYGCMCVLQ